jgi:uncharacterized protein YbcI
VPGRDDLKERIAEAVTRFGSEYMSIRAKSVSVDIHDTDILVVFRQAVCEAERGYSRERPSRDLLERLYEEAFEAVKTELDAAVKAITGRRVERSRIDVDPLAGDAIIVFVLAEQDASERQQFGADSLGMSDWPKGKEQK